MTLLTLENFYKETIVVNCTAGATNIYVLTKPVPTVGYLVMSPGTESLREIIKYTATGTDGTGDYVTVTLANRGLGGTSDIAHLATEKVRMNFTAEHQQEMSDAIDAIVAGGAQDASTTTKGIAKMSTAPATASNPIAEGDNDARLNATTGLTADEEGAIGGNSGTPSASNTFVTEEGVATAIMNFGDGSDGDVTISSVTTLTSDMYYDNLIVNDTLNTAGWRIFVKGTLSGTGTIQGVGNSGTDGLGTSSNGMGGAVTTGWFSNKAGGNGGNGGGSGGNGTAGTAGTAEPDSPTEVAGKKGGDGGGGNGGQDGGVGGGGGASTALKQLLGIFKEWSFMGFDLDVTTGSSVVFGSSGGSGGGGGGAGYGTSGNGTSGRGGGGAASGLTVVVFAFNWTGTVTIQSVGGDGGGGADASAGDAGGGGGGSAGTGGLVMVIYGTKTATGTVQSVGGTKGLSGDDIGSVGDTADDGLDGDSGVVLELDVLTLI